MHRVHIDSYTQQLKNSHFQTHIRAEYGCHVLTVRLISAQLNGMFSKRSMTFENHYHKDNCKSPAFLEL